MARSRAQFHPHAPECARSPARQPRPAVRTCRLPPIEPVVSRGIGTSRSRMNRSSALFLTLGVTVPGGSLLGIGRSAVPEGAESRWLAGLSVRFGRSAHLAEAVAEQRPKGAETVTPS